MAIKDIVTTGGFGMSGVNFMPTVGFSMSTVAPLNIVMLVRESLSTPELTLHSTATTGIGRMRLVRESLTAHDQTTPRLYGG